MTVATFTRNSGNPVVFARAGLAGRPLPKVLFFSSKNAFGIAR